MKLFSLLLILLSFPSIAETTEENTCLCENSYDSLTEEQRDEIDQFKLNNHFLSGCVTDLVNTECEALYDKAKELEKETGKKTKSFKLDYKQWKKIYQSCVAKIE